MSKERFKEVFSMTEIGKMIMDESIQKGIKEGKAEILIKQLIKKFKSVPNDYKEKIKRLSEDTIDIIATDIFEMKKIEDIEKYF